MHNLTHNFIKMVFLKLFLGFSCASPIRFSPFSLVFKWFWRTYLHKENPGSNPITRYKGISVEKRPTDRDKNNCYSSQTSFFAARMLKILFFIGTRPVPDRSWIYRFDKWFIIPYPEQKCLQRREPFFFNLFPFWKMLLSSETLQAISFSF